MTSESSDWTSAAPDVNVGAPVTAVACGFSHTCALTTTGKVRCWGSAAANGYGPNAIGDDEHPATAGDLPLGVTATAIGAGLYHTCAIVTGGALRCWGQGGSGRLGYGNTLSVIASAAGDVRTKEGSTHYEAGDYLVFNEPDGRDAYAVSKQAFERMYEPTE